MLLPYNTLAFSHVNENTVIKLARYMDDIIFKPSLNERNQFGNLRKTIAYIWPGVFLCVVKYKLTTPHKVERGLVTLVL